MDKLEFQSLLYAATRIMNYCYEQTYSCKDCVFNTEFERCPFVDHYSPKPYRPQDWEFKKKELM